MNIMIFDDNPIFVKQLHDRIIDYFTARSSQCQCETVTSTAHMVSTDLSKIDILFLDINMPEINGIHLARILRKKYPEIYIVFVTGWIEYAPAGYHVKAFRYLLKSQLDDELCRCINDIIDDIRNKKEYVRISGKKAAIDIAVSDILYFEGSAYRAVMLHTVHAHSPIIACRRKLADYEGQFQLKGFLRVQKSFLINMRHISKITGYKAYLKNGKEVRTTKHNYTQLRDKFLTWREVRL